MKDKIEAVLCWIGIGLCGVSIGLIFAYGIITTY